MTANAQAQLRQGKRKRLLRENLTAYAFLFPAALIIFTFGLFPVLFAFFVSLHRWRRFPDEYIGLGNYEEALGGAVYVVFFWLALAAIGLGLVWLWRVVQAAYRQKQFLPLTYLIPALVNAGAVLLFARWFALLLPVILDIPQRLRGQAQVQGIFVNELFLSFQMPEVAEAGNVLLLAFIAAVFASILFLRFIAIEERGALLWRVTGGPLLVVQTDERRPIAFGLLKFVTSDAPNELHLQMAASVIMIAPIMLLYFFTQKQFTEGVASSGLKG